MTTNKTLEPLQLAVVLADEIYRRAEQDFAIRITEDLDLTAVNLRKDFIQTSYGNVIEKRDDYYYGIDTGFVGRVVEKDNTIYVVYRGTDMAGGFADLGKDSHRRGERP